jgi:hypothetical protein
MRALPTLALGSSLGLVLGACFTGEATLGAICNDDSQCGVDQTCTNAVCGMCRDGERQVGELCFVPSSEEIVFGEVADLLAIDLDRDGHTEMVAVVNDDCDGEGGLCWDLHILLLADGDFEAFEVFLEPVGGRVPKVALGNFDGDEVLDVVAAAIPFDAATMMEVDNAAAVAVLYDFPSPMISMDVSAGIRVRSLEAGDLDGNGLDDLLIGSEVGNTLAFIPSTGIGFGTELLIVSDPAPRLTKPVDMDGDGDLDLIIGSEALGTVGVDLNNGNAQFSPQPRQQLDGGLGVTSVATADFDTDGNLDVVAIGLPPEEVFTPPVVVVYRGLGNGLLEPLVALPGGEFPVDVLAEDINHDGLPDIVVADLLEDKLPTYINRGGTFPDQVGIDVAAAPLTLARGTFDPDEFADLVIGNANGVISVVRSEN